MTPAEPLHPKPDAQRPGRRRVLAAGIGAALGGAAWTQPALAAPPPASPAAAPAAPAATVPAVAAAAGPVRPAPPIFVLNSLDATVSVIDAATFTERKRIPTGREPHHLYLTPDEKSLLVANAVSNSLTFIDPVTAEVQRVLTGIPDPYHLRFSPDMRWFVVACNRLDHVDLYRWEPKDAAQPLKLARRVSAGRTPSHIAIDSRSTTAYVSLQDSDQLIAIDLATQQPKWTTACGRMPADVFVGPGDRHLFVGLTGDRVVEVHDIAGAQPKVVARIETAAGAHAFRARGNQRHLFVSNRVANSISMIDMITLTVAAHLPGPAGPDCMDLMADGRTLLVSSRWAGKLSVIDIETRRLVRQVPVGRSPHGVWTLAHAPRA